MHTGIFSIKASADASALPKNNNLTRQVGVRGHL